MGKPLVGITTYVEPASWGYRELDAALIPYDYVRALERAGARPLLVPPSEDGVDETLDVSTASSSPGGADLDPATYGAEAHPETSDLSGRSATAPSSRSSRVRWRGTCPC